jgi:hypothetical protein
MLRPYEVISQPSRRISSGERIAALATLEKFLAACVQAEADKPVDEYQLRRAEAGKQSWLSRGLIMLPPKFPK